MVKSRIAGFLGPELSTLNLCRKRFTACLPAAVFTPHSWRCLYLRKCGPRSGAALAYCLEVGRNKMTETFRATRRSVLAAAGAVAAVPALAAVPAGLGAATAARQSEVARLWSQAAALTRQMLPFASQIAALAPRAGLPGWMHLSGAANDLGNRRYDTLVSILKAKPETIDDLATIASVTREHEIASGPATWARFQFDGAARDFHRAA